MRISVVLAIGLAVGATSRPIFAAQPTKDECIAASENGQDLRRVGRIAAALERFRTCSNSACPGPVRTDCETRIQEAERAQPTVRFVTTDSRGTALDDVMVRVDDSAMPLKLGEHAIAVDPGRHHFEFDAGKAGKVTKTIDIVEGAKGRREIIVLEPAAERASANESDLLLGLPQRTLAYVAGGTSALLLVIGSATGLVAKSKYDDAVRSCDPAVNSQRFCEDAGIKEGDSAKTMATVSTVAFIAGGVFGATAIVLYATAPARKDDSALSAPSVSVNVTSTSLQVTGAW